MLSRDPHVVRLMVVKQGQNKEGKTALYLVFEYMDTDLKKYIRRFRQTGGHIPPETAKNLGDNDAISVIIESLGEKSDLLRHEGRVGLTGEILWDMEEMKPPEHWQGMWKRVVVVGGGVAGSLVAKSLQFHADVNLIDPPVQPGWVRLLKGSIFGFGRLKIDENLRVKGCKNIFAIGDITDIKGMENMNSM